MVVTLICACRVYVVFRLTKMKMENSWFERAAREVDIELDEEALYPCVY